MPWTYTDHEVSRGVLTPARARAKPMRIARARPVQLKPQRLQQGQSFPAAMARGSGKRDGSAQVLVGEGAT